MKEIIAVEVAPVTKESVRQGLENRGLWKTYWNYIDTSGEHTKELLKILPKDTILAILRVYKTITYYKERYNSLSRKDQFPKKDLERIRQILKKYQTEYISKKNKMIVKRKWFDKEDIDDIMRYIFDKMKQTPKGMKTLTAIGKEQIKKKEKQTKPTDLALNLTIYLLAEHLKSKTNNHNWILICNFLTEQKILNLDEVTSTEHTIRDRYRKTKANKLKEQYENYRKLYLFAEKNIRRNLSPQTRQDLYQQRTHERDIMLPYWIDLLPQ